MRLSWTTRKARCATGPETRSRSPSKRQRDVEPAAAGTGDHLVHQREVRSADAIVRAATEELDQPLEVLAALSRGLRDRSERLLGACRVRVDESLPGCRLDHHHADRVADDVVQLAGDPRPLVAQGDLGEELALLLELLGAHGQLVGGLPGAVAARFRRRRAAR